MFCIIIFAIADLDLEECGVAIMTLRLCVCCVIQMGYANSEQVGSGIHFRQYSRAYIIADSSNNRVVFISADIHAGTQIVKIEVGIIIKLRICQISCKVQESIHPVLACCIYFNFSFGYYIIIIK